MQGNGHLSSVSNRSSSLAPAWSRSFPLYLPFSIHSSVTLWGQCLSLLYIPMTTQRMRVLLYEPPCSTLPDWYAHLPSITPLIHSLHSCHLSKTLDIVASRLRLKAFNDSHCHQNKVQTPQHDLRLSKISRTDVSWLFFCPFQPSSTRGTSDSPLQHEVLLIPQCTDQTA